MNNLDYVLLETPWGCVHEDRKEVSHGRPCLMIQATGLEIRCTRLRCSLSPMGAVNRGEIFELPSVGTISEDQYASEELILSYRGNNIRGNISSFQTVGLPRPVVSSNNEELDLWQDLGITTMAMLDSHLEWVNSLYDEVSRPKWGGDSWEGHAEGVAIRNLTYSLDKWKESGRSDEPRFSLIVHMEREQKFRQTLENVCFKPRKVLSRHRTMMSISRIQDVDPVCLRWLVRQPGVSLAQKAGPRQEAMGIIRIENADTLENRVVRDLLLRASDACSLYIQENRRFAKHDRVWRIRKFRRELQQMLINSEITSAKPLVGIVNPNYVLQHDLRYSLLWKFYLLLVRRQKQQDDVWRWRQRTWAEHVSMAFLSSLNELSPIKCFDHADALIRGEQINGTFVDERSDIPSIPIKRFGEQHWIEFVRRKQLKKYPFVTDGLRSLSPDFIIAIRPQFGRKPLTILAVWTILDFGLGESQDQRYLESLNKALKQHTDSSVRGLILRPLAPNQKDFSEQIQLSVTLAVLPIQFQTIPEKITGLLNVLLNLEKSEHV